MISRVIDKFLIIAFTMIIQLVLYEKGINGSTVVAFLFAVIMTAVFEINNKYLFIFITLPFVAILNNFLSISTPLNCILVYSLFVSLEVKEEMKEIRFANNMETEKKKLFRSIVSVIITVLICIYEGLKAATLYGTNAIAVSVIMLLLAMIFGIKNSLGEAALEKYYNLYDASRLESRQLKRQRKEAYEKNEEEVYMATLKERNRIAREIHDNVGHMLTRAIVQLQALKVINDSELTKPYIDSINDTVNQAMLNIRKSVHELHDDSVDMSVEIAECLKALPDNIKGELKTSIESSVSTDIKNTCIAVVREAITNISKYSKGNKALVEIVEHSAFWRIKIWDNGKNENRDYSKNLRDKGASNGLGLIGIMERIDKLGGNVNISSNTEGFTVLVTIPKD